ncbi:Hypothetical predicted protein [Cloeon dipterum]|uniref:Receptor ligand binding region domain-containing protein n=1 Tax=Cloeon dipterum TaxID=197152 RepID=A0A8S1C191_9INSE|nr:Hypothetical predicted protein [Cloeon dipterum]
MAVRVVILLLAAALGGLASASICPIEEDVGSVEAVVVALVDLHTGRDCDRLSLPALQKIAAAKQSALRHSQDVPISLGVHVMDTCGDKKKAVKLAFKSMVYSDKSICKNPPMLLGYLGPDEVEIFDAVNSVTGVYKYIHVNPVAMLDINNPYFVSRLEQPQIVKALTSSLRHLHWSHFTLLHSEDVESSLLASSLSSTPGLCVPSVRQLQMASLPTALDGVPTRGVLVVGTPDHLLQVLQANARLDVPHVLLLVTLDAGLLPPLALMDSLPDTAAVLQLAPDRPIDKLQYHLEKSELWDEYLHQQRCNFSLCSNTAPEVPELAATVQDVAAVATADALASFARALRVAHRVKCLSAHGTCAELEATLPDEWRSRVGAQLGAQTQMLAHFEVFLKNPFSSGLHRVTNFSSLNFPDSRGDECHHEAGVIDVPKKVTRRVTATTTTPVPHILIEDTDYHSPEQKGIHNTNNNNEERPKKVLISPEEDDSYDYVEQYEIKHPSKGKGWTFLNMHELSSTEFYTIMAGFACIVGIVLCSLIYCVASIFRVKDGNNENRRNNRRNNNNRDRNRGNRNQRAGSIQSGQSSV